MEYDHLFLAKAMGKSPPHFWPNRTVKGIDCLGRGGIQALGKRLANASPLRPAGLIFYFVMSMFFCLPINIYIYIYGYIYIAIYIE